MFIQVHTFVCKLALPPFDSAPAGLCPPVTVLPQPGPYRTGRTVPFSAVRIRGHRRSPPQRATTNARRNDAGAPGFPEHQPDIGRPKAGRISAAMRQDSHRRAKPGPVYLSNIGKPCRQTQTIANKISNFVEDSCVLRQNAPAELSQQRNLRK